MVLTTPAPRAAGQLAAMSVNVLIVDIGNGEYGIFIWGWGVEPSPDGELSVFTRGQRSHGSGPNYTPNWSDSFYCNPPTTSSTPSNIRSTGRESQRRAAMQKMLYEGHPYAVLYYETTPRLTAAINSPLSRLHPTTRRQACTSTTRLPGGATTASARRDRSPR